MISISISGVTFAGGRYLPFTLFFSPFLPKKCLLKIKKWGEPLLLREKLCIYFLQKDIRSLFGLNLNVCFLGNTSFQGGIFQTHSDINLVQSCFIVHNRCPFFHLNNLEPVSLSLSFFSGFLRHSRMWIEKKGEEKGKPTHPNIESGK